MQNDEARHRKIELAELTNEPWCLPSLESSPWPLVADAFRAHGVGPSTISHRDHHFEEPKHQAQWHDFRSTRLQDRSQRANSTVSLCVVVASASTANFREGSKSDGSRLSVTSPAYPRLPTYFSVAASRRSGPHQHRTSPATITLQKFTSYWKRVSAVRQEIAGCFVAGQHQRPRPVTPRLPHQSRP